MLIDPSRTDLVDQLRDEVTLTCCACGVATGPFDSYEEWEDTARQLAWEVGEEIVLCAICAGTQQSRPPQ